MMKYLLLSMLLVAAAACTNKPRPEQIETLEMVEQEAVKKNLDLYSQINQTVHDFGKRPEHLKVLEQAQNVLEKREKLDMKLQAGETYQHLDSAKVKAYLKEMELVVADIGKRNKDQKIHLNAQLETVRNRSEKLLAEEGDLTGYYIVLNFLYLESAILNQLLKELGTHG